MQNEFDTTDEDLVDAEALMGLIGSGVPPLEATEPPAD